MIEEAYKELLGDYRCDNIKADHCPARDSVKELQLSDGEEMCKKVCCIGCNEVCGYRCSLANETERELKSIAADMCSALYGKCNTERMNNEIN